MGNAKKPLGRTKDLVVQELNGEVLIYDLRDHRAFCLNETSSLVWTACDGNTPVNQIGKRIGSEDVVWLALDQLKEERLLENGVDADGPFAGISRRDVIRKIGLGTAIALPVVASIVAPTAASAQSCLPNNTTCTASAQCCSNCCRAVGGGVNECKPGGGACLP